MDRQKIVNLLFELGYSQVGITFLFQDNTHQNSCTSFPYECYENNLYKNGESEIRPDFGNVIRRPKNVPKNVP